MTVIYDESDIESDIGDIAVMEGELKDGISVVWCVPCV